MSWKNNSKRCQCRESQFEVVSNLHVVTFKDIGRLNLKRMLYVAKIYKELRTIERIVYKKHFKKQQKLHTI